jgi:hypothetical protein
MEAAMAYSKIPPRICLKGQNKIIKYLPKLPIPGLRSKPWSPQTYDKKGILKHLASFYRMF